jgi:transcriptional regulator with XRE-family HTH domain
MNYGTMLKRRRLTEGMTLTDASEASGYSRGAISMIENGLTRPEMERIIAYMRAINMPLDEQRAVLEGLGMPMLAPK